MCLIRIAPAAQYITDRQLQQGKGRDNCNPQSIGQQVIIEVGQGRLVEYLDDYLNWLRGCFEVVFIDNPHPLVKINTLIKARFVDLAYPTTLNV